MNNVVNLRAYKTFNECKKLLKGYEAKMLTAHKQELLAELERYVIEANRYPNHLLTIVKGTILMRILSSRTIAATELYDYINKESHRLSKALNRRLYAPT